MMYSGACNLMCQDSVSAYTYGYLYDCVPKTLVSQWRLKRLWCRLVVSGKTSIQFANPSRDR